MMNLRSQYHFQKLTLFHWTVLKFHNLTIPSSFSKFYSVKTENVKLKFLQSFNYIKKKKQQDFAAFVSKL